MKIRVYYEDTDVGGIVYHANYLKFCERARSEYFFQSGSSPQLEGGEFVVVSLEAKFKASAKLGDTLEIKTEVLNLKGSSFTLNQSVYKDNIILFNMNVRLGFMKLGKVGRMSTQAQIYLRELFSKGLSDNLV